MNRARNLVVTVASLALLLGLAVGLIALFSAASQSQPSSQALRTAAPSPADSTSTPAPHSAGILFESAGELYWQPVDGEGKATDSVIRVPTDLAPKSKITQLYPALDGTQIAYRVATEGPADSEGTWALYIFSPPNGPTRQIISMAEGISAGKIFGWHPNTRQIVYWTENGIGLFDVQSSEKTVIARPEEWANLPYDPQVDGIAFSPDGKQMIVSYTLTGQMWEVWMVKYDNSEPRMLFKTDHPVFAFAWSPDGHYIAFVGQGLEVMTSDGQDRKILSRDFSVGWAFEPTWSPDSRLIAFTAAVDSSDNIFARHKVRLADPLTGKERDLMPSSLGGEIEPAWSPDGEHIIFLSDRGGTPEIWSTSPDGMNLQQLTFDGQPKRWNPVWLPESRR